MVQILQARGPGDNDKGGRGAAERAARGRSLAAGVVLQPTDPGELVVVPLDAQGDEYTGQGIHDGGEDGDEDCRELDRLADERALGFLCVALWGVFGAFFYLRLSFQGGGCNYLNADVGKGSNREAHTLSLELALFSKDRALYRDSQQGTGVIRSRILVIFRGERLPICRLGVNLQVRFLPVGLYMDTYLNLLILSLNHLQ